MPGHSTTIVRAPTARRRLVATLVVIVVSMLGLALAGSPVSAHTSFVRSDPADGSTVAGAVSDIVIEFTGVSTEAGDGFVVRDSNGQVRTPEVTTNDGKTFTLRFAEPLDDGLVGVRWSVRAGDAHPIDGSFSFTVDTDAVAPTGAGSTAPSDEPASAAMADGATMSAAEMAAMGDFLQVEPERSGETVALIGRLVELAAIVLAIGGLAFAATTLVGSRSEVEAVVGAIRVVGLVIVAGAIAEYVGVIRLIDSDAESAWTSAPGGATALRVAGGLAIALGVFATTAPVRTMPIARSLSSAAAVAEHGSRPATSEDRERLPDDPSRAAMYRWAPGRSSWLGFVGVGLLVVSFWFDGHTMSKGFRPFHDVVNSVHVLAGSVWAGGVMFMAVLLWSRQRRHQRAGALELVVRFSSVASVALAAVVVAGLVMAALILDSPGALWSTEWGQTLLLKSTAAGLAIIAGAYNHFRLKPALEHRPDDVDLQRSVRMIVSAEAVLLAFVLVVTASLVAAASS